MSIEINEGNSIHFGFDHMCCSAMCRTQIGTIIIHKDPRLFNPEKWKIAGNNPWNALTPEWLTSSPPPVENWEGEAPLVEEPYGYGKEISEQK